MRYVCDGCRSTEIHGKIMGRGGATYASEAVARRCRVKRLELDAKREVKRGVDIDVDHPIMVEYRSILRAQWVEGSK